VKEPFVLFHTITLSIRLIDKAGVRALHAVCDVADHDAARAFLAEVHHALRDVDLLVHSAGVLRDKPLALMSAADAPPRRSPSWSRLSVRPSATTSPGRSSESTGESCC